MISSAGQFRYTGTRDFTPLLAIADAQAFYEQLGPARVMQYMHTLITQAVRGEWSSLLTPRRPSCCWGCGRRSCCARWTCAAPWSPSACLSVRRLFKVDR